MNEMHHSSVISKLDDSGGGVGMESCVYRVNNRELSMQPWGDPVGVVGGGG